VKTILGRDRPHHVRDPVGRRGRPRPTGLPHGGDDAPRESGLLRHAPRRVEGPRRHRRPRSPAAEGEGVGLFLDALRPHRRGRFTCGGRRPGGRGRGAADQPGHCCGLGALRLDGRRLRADSREPDALFRPRLREAGLGATRSCRRAPSAVPLLPLGSHPGAGGRCSCAVARCYGHRGGVGSGGMALLTSCWSVAAGAEIVWGSRPRLPLESDRHRPGCGAGGPSRAAPSRNSARCA
jgi:hypothetical protein